MNGKQHKKRSADDMAEGEGSDNDDEDAGEPPHKKFKVDRYVDRGWRLRFRFEKKKKSQTFSPSGMKFRDCFGVFFG